MSGLKCVSNSTASIFDMPAYPNPYKKIRSQKDNSRVDARVREKINGQERLPGGELTETLAIRRDDRRGSKCI